MTEEDKCLDLLLRSIDLLSGLSRTPSQDLIKIFGTEGSLDLLHSLESRERSKPNPNQNILDQISKLKLHHVSNYGEGAK